MNALLRLARVVRTLFAWISALTVAVCGLSAAFGSEVSIMGAGAEVRGIGLTYHGRGGAALAFTEAVLVLAAWFAARRPSGAARSVGSAALVAWALLWCFNATRWMQADPETMTRAIAIGLVASLACALAALRPAHP